MKYTFFSKILQRDLTFSRPGSGYIYVDLNGKEGTLGNQICIHGKTMGPAMEYYGRDQIAFQHVCRHWWREYTRRHRDSEHRKPPKVARIDKVDRRYVIYDKETGEMLYHMNYSKADAMRKAWELGYTHCVGTGTYYKEKQSAIWKSLRPTSRS